MSDETDAPPGIAGQRARGVHVIEAGSHRGPASTQATDATRVRRVYLVTGTGVAAPRRASGLATSFRHPSSTATTPSTTHDRPNIPHQHGI